MTTELLSPTVTTVEKAPTTRTISAAPSAIVAFLGVTERGRVGVPVNCTSFQAYTNEYGSFDPNSDVAIAIQGFFQNGGQNAWVVRTVHYTDITSAATKTSAAATIMLQTDTTAPSSGTVTGTGQKPHDLETGQTLTANIDAGGDATATFTAVAATRTAANTETYALVDAQTLLVAIDGGGVQTITFNTAEFAAIGAATASEVAAVINAEIAGAFADVNATAVRITSDRKGTGSGVNVSGGTANAVLGFVTGNVAGTGNVSNIDAVTGAEAKTIIEAAIAGCTVTTEGTGELTITSDTTGASSSVAVNASSTAIAFGFDNATHSGDSGTPGNTLKVDGKTDGTYGNLLKVIPSAATSGVATEFNLQVQDDGLIVETFPNVTMDDLLDNFVETVVNATSRLITVTDQDSTSSDPRPAFSTSAFMAGGNDGLTSLDDNDFVGSQAGGTGLHAFDQVEDLTLLVVPGRATSAVHNAMLIYCQTFRDAEMFTILDPPSGLSAAGMVAYVKTTAALLNFSSYGAIYWPEIKVLNPSTAVFGNTTDLTVPPSGYLAGVYARGDGVEPGGVYKSPAGVERGIIAGMVGFANDEVKEKAKRDLLYPARINPITITRGNPRHVDGSRTLKGNGNFSSIPERRGVINIGTSLKVGLSFLKHSPNTENQRALANRTVTAFLIQQMNNGAFKSTEPSKAFYVDTSNKLNTPTVVDSGTMIIRIGLAMAKPSEFVVIEITPDTRALDEEIAAAS